MYPPPRIDFENYAGQEKSYGQEKEPKPNPFAYREGRPGPAAQPPPPPPHAEYIPSRPSKHVHGGRRRSSAEKAAAAAAAAASGPGRRGSNRDYYYDYDMEKVRGDTVISDDSSVYSEDLSWGPPRSRSSQRSTSTSPEYNNNSRSSFSSYPSKSLPSPMIMPKMTGYPQVAAEYTARPQRACYRRFTALNHRILLHMQDEIVELEKVLSGLDAQCSASSLRSRRRGLDEHRLSVLGFLGWKINQYNTALKAYQDIAAIEAPKPEDVGDARKWVDLERPVVDEEAGWLSEESDLIVLKSSVKKDDKPQRQEQEQEQQERVESPADPVVPSPELDIEPVEQNWRELVEQNLPLLTPLIMILGFLLVAACILFSSGKSTPIVVFRDAAGDDQESVSPIPTRGFVGTLVVAVAWVLCLSPVAVQGVEVWGERYGWPGWDEERRKIAVVAAAGAAIVGAVGVSFV